MSKPTNTLLDQIEDTLRWNLDIYGPLYLDESIQKVEKPEVSSASSQAKSVSSSDRPKESSKKPEDCSSLIELRALAEQDAALFTDLPSTKLVFGSGPDSASVMLIGEAPGEEENRQGLPFVGAAGQLLTKMLKAINLDRREVYITNILKHRPPNNRNPKADEIAQSMPYLHRQIDLVKPKIMLCLGKQAANALLGNQESLKNLRQQELKLKDVPMHITYHPAALLRNPNWKRPAWEDLQQFQKHLESL